MPDIAQIITSGAGNPWLYLPLAVLIGALHAMEPGHAKSIMAAFIIAVRGTAGQAILLGISAAIGHTLVVWGLVLAGLWLGSDLIEKQAYPWLVLVSGLLVIMIAARLIVQVARGRFRSRDHDHDHHHDHDDHHGHHHANPEEIAARYGGRRVRAWEIMWFGFTGGLLPCPSAIAVLIAALHFKAYALGVVMVAAFSLGLAVTLVAVGLVAVWGMKRVAFSGTAARWTAHLPLASALLVACLGLAMLAHGISLLGAA